jgi:wyosine [tRNA(Phe)-imidazoG37] synthetase (radical SAM superfamily)
MADSRPMMAIADADGQVYQHPELEMLGWDGECWRPLEDDEIIPLPDGSDLFTLPGRLPAGLDREADQVVVVDEPGVTAVSCFLAPAYLRTLLPAYQTLDDAPGLPLFAYSAVGLRDGEFVTSGLRVDSDVRQDPLLFELADVTAGVEQMRTQHPDNRLIEHLQNCALEYHCRAAQNYFLHRHEAPMPAAPTCNAVCVGCISFQRQGGDDQYLAAHDRIPFAPTPDDLTEVALGHIERVGQDAVVSFGQGCEGEPLMQSTNLLETVRRIRETTDVGIVNLNSNASRPLQLKNLFDAGLDSLRISTNSARENVYTAYYRPTTYNFNAVLESARVARKAGAYLMLNYFVFPGVTDTESELEALSMWIQEVDMDMVQLRNLNMDPEVYLETVTQVGHKVEAMGVLPWLRELRRRFPRLRFGYFNPPQRRFDEAPSLLVRQSG